MNGAIAGAAGGAPSDAPNDDASCVALRDVVFHYPDGPFRLRVDELQVRHREKVAIIGPSGSGKTTLLNLIAGILPTSSGSIAVSGAILRGASERQRRQFRITRIGMIFQEFELLEHLTVRENILLPYYINPALRLTPEVEEYLNRVTRRAGLADMIGRKPRGLSQGERQRVAICRALINSPKLLLADEPTGNLDPETTHDILDSIFDEVDQAEATLLMVTHDHTLLGRFERTIDFADFQERTR